MRREKACRRCGGDILEHGTRAWCVQPTLDGGCGGHFSFDEGKGRFARHATSKRDRVVAKR